MHRESCFVAIFEGGLAVDYQKLIVSLLFFHMFTYFINPQKYQVFVINLHVAQKLIIFCIVFPQVDNMI